MTTDTLIDSAESRILERQKKFLSGSQASPCMVEINQAAAKRFEELKFPHSKHEMFTFVNTKKLTETNFDIASGREVDKDFVASHIYEGSEKSCLILVDGVFDSDLSDTSAFGKEFEVLRLSEALSNSKIKQSILDTLEEENDVFAALNGSFFNQGILVRIAPKASFEVPLQLLHISTGADSQPVMTCPRVLIELNALAELNVISKFVGTDGGYCVNAVQDFILGENSGMKFTQVQADDKESQHLTKNRVSLGRDSRFHSVNASSGCQLARHHYEVHLEGAGAELKLNGINVLNGEEQAHYYIRVFHEAPQCTSTMHFKTIVNEKARTSVDGTVIVEKDAQLTNSDQLINSMILSDDAHADSKPNLLINADDVKCTHGNTVGQLDQEHLFYLKTRGLSEDIAKTILTQSFVASIIETIEFPSVRKSLENTLLKKLEAGHA